MQRLRPVQPILEGEPGLCAYALHRHAHELEVLAVILYGLGLIGEARIHIGYQPAYVAAREDLAEGVVAPDYLSAAIEQHAGYGYVGYDVARRGVVFPEYVVHGVFDRLFVGQHREKAYAEADGAQGKHHIRHPPVQECQIQQPTGRRRRYEQRYKRKLRFFVHNTFLPRKKAFSRFIFAFAPCSFRAYGKACPPRLLCKARKCCTERAAP